ncbi:hypothetical protein B0O80DRAFT_453820 [Mortierella sp. GBAus27b]|nr:hypothetical protein BGX31_005899 [Mortierella sp. GBA43]KAI8352738.1 hypothetical protein B0O80DRAFT_453820 [Mortierella sp. GBAus27b]
MKPSTATGTAAATAKPAKQEVMSQTLPDNHRNATNALLATLAQVETLLAPLFATPTTLSETMAKLDMEKRCQLELLMTFAINTLAYINLRTNGITPTNHPVMQELKRIKAYTEKLRLALQGNKANMEVDKDAAARFIRGALAANDIADRKAAAEEAAANVSGSQKRDHDEGDLGSTSSRPSKSQKSDDLSSESPSTSTPAPTSQSRSNRKRTMDPFQGFTDNSKKNKKPDSK